MGAKPARLKALIESVVDGKSVDWDMLEGGAAASQQRLLRHLRLVASVAEVHRTVVDDDPGVAPTMTEPAAVTAIGPGRRRWGHLELFEKIGEGSFGEVYRARDPSLDREVALKLLKRDVAGRVPAARIIAEARTLARLRHPNVVTVYGVDTHDGRVGLWMELVRGRTLRQILASEGAFSANEAAVIGQELCRALAAVHAAGLVHEDVKAQNVMRESGGRLVLMDFGAGGTPLYLAPEILRGAKASVASDLYALGVLLFQLVTGRYPLSGASIHDLDKAHSSRSRLRLGDVRPDLPDSFVAAVERALDPNPSDRFAGATEMREALAGVSVRGQRIGGSNPVIPRPRFFRWAVVIPALLLALAIMLVSGLAWRASHQVTVQARRSVAVLPFRAIGNDPETVFYSDGLSEDLTGQLANLASVTVLSGTSTRRYQASSKSPVEIGQELEVDALVSGSVRLSQHDIRVVVELVDTRTSQQLWAKVFERPRREIVRIQSEVVEQVSLALKGALTAEDVSRLRRQAIEPRAFELYLKARYYWNTRTPEGLRRSITHFREAIAIDPRSALPQAGLADAYMLAAFYYLERPAAAHAQAEAAAFEALRLDPNLAQAHAALGSLRLTQFRWGEAEGFLKRAIELNPSYATARHWYALWLVQHRRFEDALSEMRAALEADPFSYVLRSAAAYIVYTARDYDAAVREYRQVLDVDPSFFQAHHGLIDALAARGSYDEALAAIKDAEVKTSRANDLRLQYAYVYALAGRRDESLRALRAVEADLDTTDVSRASIASVYAFLGEETRAYEWLDRAVQDGDGQLGYLGVDPRFDRMRGDPRFERVMKSLGIVNQ